MQNKQKGNKKFRKPKSDIETKTVNINRVYKITKGGRNQSFSALSVAGNKKGKVGIGFGKAVEVRDAIEKANEDAKKNMKDKKTIEQVKDYVTEMQKYMNKTI